MPSLDLLLISPVPANLEWKRGRIFHASPTPAAVNGALRNFLKTSPSLALLCWDPSLGPVPAKALDLLTFDRADVWHSGLRLGTSGQPSIIDRVEPVWMFNRDPDPDIEATSWRLTWRACLISREVIRQMGSLDQGYHTLDMAILDWGLRLLRAGCRTRHAPVLAPAVQAPRTTMKFPATDEVRFIRHNFGRSWTWWAISRLFLSSDRRAPGFLFHAIGESVRTSRTFNPKFGHPLSESIIAPDAIPPSFSVLIPTVGRYPFLRTLLAQMRELSPPPVQVIVIDQTAESDRLPSFYEEFQDLPLHLIFLSPPGQCSARNAGLARCTGELVLLLDDDVELHPGFISSHLDTLRRFHADASCGVFEERGRGPLPASFTRARLSDVFPAGNTLLRLAALAGSGFFDLAYDHGSRADGDLGMRLYLSGANLMLNPALLMYHHRAPAGGLRCHGARIETYASSRSSLTGGNLPSVSELFLARRYFSPLQVQEMLWQKVFGAFSITGGWWRKLGRAFFTLCLLPHFIYHLRKRMMEAESRQKSFPLLSPSAFAAPKE